MTGRTIGKYRIVEKLGRGGMGTVYKAVDETLDREVAVKVLNPNLSDSDVMKRFQKEAMTLAKLHHPDIATIHEIYQSESDLLMVMELVRGETFDQLLQRTGPLQPERAAYLVAQLLGALDHAHRAGVVHRDLKPANVMVTERGTIKVLDFGIAYVSGSEHMTADGFLVGTPAYMAPERVTGGQVDGRADLYSVGVLFYRLLTGQLPFKADTAVDMVHQLLLGNPTPAHTYRADIPAWCESILERALAKAPNDRFQTAEAFRATLVAAITSTSNEATGLFTVGDVALSPSDPSIPKVPAPSAVTPKPATPAPMPVAAVPAAAMPTLVAPAAEAKAASVSTPVGSYAPTIQARTPTPGPIPAVPAAAPSASAPIVSASAAHRMPSAIVTPTGTLAAGGLDEAAPYDGASPAVTSTGTLVLKRKQFAVAGLTLAGVTVLVIVLAVLALRQTAPDSTTASGPPAAAETPAAPDASVPTSTSPPTLPPLEIAEPEIRTSPPDANPGPPLPKAPEAVARRPLPATPIAGTTTARTPVDTTPFQFDAKAVVADGDKRRERDATVLVADGTITVLEEDRMLYSIPVAAIMSLTYSNSRQPLWNSPNGPAEAMRVEGGGLFRRGGRNWFGVRTAESLLVVRVDDDVVGRVITGLQDRTGLTLERLIEPKD